MPRLASITVLLALLAVPTSGLAYLTPEEVLRNGILQFPTKRESDAAIVRQQERSRETREREQELLFSLQHPEWDEQEEVIEDALAADETPKAAAPDLQLSERDLELLKALRLIDEREQRLLDRINTRQQLARLRIPGTEEALHSGAPYPLAPTGAGAWLAAVTMAGAVGWTMWKVKQSGTVKTVK